MSKENDWFEAYRESCRLEKKSARLRTRLLRKIFLLIPSHVFAPVFGCRPVNPRHIPLIFLMIRKVRKEWKAAEVVRIRELNKSWASVRVRPEGEDGGAAAGGMSGGAVGMG